MDEAEALLMDLKPDLAVFVESWLDDQIPSTAINIPGYVSFRNDRNSSGGGILCYVSNHFSVREVDNPKAQLSLYDTEMFSFYINELRLLVVAIYHPVWNNLTKHEGAISCILEVIDNVLSSDNFPPHSKVILCGDFNDMHKLRTRITHLSGLRCHVEASTRSDRSLDLIFSNYDTDVKARVYPPISRSDHAVVFWKSVLNSKPRSKKIRVRKYSKSNLARFRDYMISTDWLRMVSSELNLENAASIFLSTLTYLFDTCFPERTITIRKTDPAWMTVSLRILLKERDSAWRDKNMSKYLRLRKEVDLEIRRAKSGFLRAGSSTRDAKTLWRTIKECGRMSNCNRSFASISVDEFSDYFSSVYRQPGQTSKQNKSHDLPDAPLVVSVYEVNKLLMTMRKKSPGVDGLPHWIFRKFSVFLSPALTHIFNQSFQEGKVPTCFKEALVTPVPKIANPSLPCHFRPISLLPLVSKILEKLVVRHWILPYISDLDKSQFAYVPRSGSGTTSALTFMHNRIVSYLDARSGAVRLLALDFSKAFDTLPFDTIIQSCRKANIPSQAVNWISSYLNNRRQSVHFHGSSSLWRSLPSGVPQGSIIGPLLFSISASQLLPLHENSTVVKYADDITILHFMRNNEDDNLQSELNNVISWSTAAGLQLNLSKCSVTNFVTKTSLCCSPIVCPNGVALPVSRDVKILGVIFSDDFSWSKHVQSQVKKASKRIFLLRNLKRADCDENVLYNVYTCLIRSVLLFAYPCFCNAPMFLHELLSKVEKRAFRIIFNKKSSDFQCINRAAQTLCENFFQKILNLRDHPLRSLFVDRVPTTRNPCTLRRPFARTKRFSNSFIKFCP